MATVYRARDLKHERTVAIKVLRPDLTEAIGADRFLREIRTTANLSHPHILPLFDSGEVDGLLYYVMPFVKGESLRDRLEREGQLPIDDALQIAREVAGALAYAHREGVIHRDIKPANILLEEGHALLADFGIAQAKASADETRLTGGGMSLGTPAYMSPEQISGEKEVDGRADQYALGCLLFEMLAGHAPFTGADVQTVMRQHLAADAPSVTQARASVPKGVAKAVHRAMAKAPADRFRTAAEFEKALAGATLPLLARIPMGRARGVVYGAMVVLVVAGVVLLSRITSATPDASSVDASTEPRLVPNNVLVTLFQNRTGDPELDYVGEFAAERIIDALSRMGTGLLVVQSLETARALASASPGDTNANPAEPGEACRPAVNAGAGLLVWGNIYRQGDSLRVSSEVVDVASCNPIWPLDDVMIPVGEDPGPDLAVLAQSAAGAVAGQVDPRGSWSEQGTTPPPSLDGFLEVFAAERASGRRKVEHLRRALEFDSTWLYPRLSLVLVYVLAGERYSSLADSQADLAWAHRDQGTPVERALLDGYRAHLRGDREGTYEAARRVVDLNGAPWDLANLAHEAKHTNRPREAVQLLTDLDPRHPDLERNPFFWNDLAESHHMLGQYDEALDAAREGRLHLPENQNLILSEARALAALGHADEALGMAQELENRWGPSYSLFDAGGYLLRYGHGDAAAQVFERILTLIEDLPEDQGESFGALVLRGETLLMLDRPDEARELLSQAVEEQPENPGPLVSLGVVAARLGERGEAEEIAARIARADLPYDLGRRESYRGWIAAALGDRPQALELLKEAYADGMKFGADLHANSWLEPLRGYPPFEEWLRPKG